MFRQTDGPTGIRTDGITTTERWRFPPWFIHNWCRIYYEYFVHLFDLNPQLNMTLLRPIHPTTPSLDSNRISLHILWHVCCIQIRSVPSIIFGLSFPFIRLDQSTDWLTMTDWQLLNRNGYKNMAKVYNWVEELRAKWGASINRTHCIHIPYTICHSRYTMNR